jgi:hypothetical protein
MALAEVSGSRGSGFRKVRFRPMGEFDGVVPGAA